MEVASHFLFHLIPMIFTKSRLYESTFFLSSLFLNTKLNAGKPYVAKVLEHSSEQKSQGNQNI